MNPLSHIHQAKDCQTIEDVEIAIAMVRDVIKNHGWAPRIQTRYNALQKKRGKLIKKKGRS